MSPVLILLAIPPILATMLTVSACMLSSRTSRALEGAGETEFEPMSFALPATSLQHAGD